MGGLCCDRMDDDREGWVACAVTGWMMTGKGGVARAVTGWMMTGKGGWLVL